MRGFPAASYQGSPTATQYMNDLLGEVIKNTFTGPLGDAIEATAPGNRKYGGRRKSNIPRIRFPRGPGIIPHPALTLWELYTEWVLTQLGPRNTPSFGRWNLSVDCLPPARGPFPSSISVCGGTIGFRPHLEGTITWQDGANFRTYFAAYIGNPITYFTPSTSPGTPTQIGGTRAQGWTMQVPLPAPIIDFWPPMWPATQPYYNPWPRKLPPKKPQWNDKPEPKKEPKPEERLTVRAAPQTAPQLVRERPRVVRTRPPRHNREKKLVGPRLVLFWLGQLFAGMTEAKDLLECMHKSIPKQFRKDNSMYQQFLDVYRNADLIHVEKLVRCVLSNAVEDWLMGTLNRKANKALMRLRDLTGTNFGSTHPGNVPGGPPHDPKAGPFDPMIDPIVDGIMEVLFGPSLTPV